jgi:hypothetical protein
VTNTCDSPREVVAFHDGRGCWQWVWSELRYRKQGC